MTSSETARSVPPTTDDPAEASPRGRRLRRLGGVALTVVLTLVVWAIGRLAGADYVFRDPAGDVVVDGVVTGLVTAVLSLLGWGVLALLERWTRHGARIWAALAAVVVVASMIPIFLVDATPGTQIALFFVHLAVGALVPALLRAR